MALRNIFNDIQNIKNKARAAGNAIGNYASAHPIIATAAYFGAAGIGAGALLAGGPLTLPIAIGLGIAVGTGEGAAIGATGVGIAKVSRRITAAVRNKQTEERSLLTKSFVQAAKPAVAAATRIKMWWLNQDAELARREYWTHKITSQEVERRFNDARDYALQHYPRKPQIGTRTGFAQPRADFLRDIRAKEAAQPAKKSPTFLPLLPGK